VKGDEEKGRIRMRKNNWRRPRRRRKTRRGYIWHYGILM
jgi:hypothetical protein